jgi:transcriptional regulator with XRE-family HTH domain
MIGLEYIVKMNEGTFRSLSKELGVAHTTVADWISGRRPIPKPKLEALSELYGMEEDIFSKEIDELDKIEIRLEFLRRKSQKEGFEIPDIFEDEKGKKYETVRWFDPYEKERAILMQELEIEKVLLELRRNLFSELYDNEREFRGLNTLKMLKELSIVLNEIAPDHLSGQQRKAWEKKHLQRLNFLKALMYYLGAFRKEWGKDFIEEGSIEEKIHDTLEDLNLIWSEEELKGK